MKTVFGDTFYYLALINADDNRHEDVIMHREGITEALTGDRHFEQAGFIALLR